MGFYKHEVTEKTWDKFAETDEKILEATISIAPHADIERDRAYEITGVGKMFGGTYRFKRVTHTFTPGDYSVDVDARMVFDSKGRYVENGAAKATAPVKKEEPKKVPDKAYTVSKGDNLWNIAKKFCKKATDCWEIAKFNGIKNPDLIYPNQKINIPSHLLK